MNNININRRRFIQSSLTSATIAGATWFDTPKILAAKNKKAGADEYNGFPMGIQSYSLRGFGVDGAIEQTAKLGLHFIEFFSGHFPITKDKIKIGEMNQKLGKFDMNISAHGVNSFGDDHAKNEVIFKFAQMAGIKNISANPAPNSFDSLDKLVAKYDIRIAIHNHGPGGLYDKIEDGIKAVKGHDKRIGFCADLGHYIRSGEDPIEVINKLGSRLYGIHLKDFAEQKKSTHGVILGKGHLDVAGVFKALKKVKFPADGALSLEYEETPNDHPKLLSDIKECLTIAADGAKKA
jgi:sugar phosphate isomerase/epimerase